MIKQIIDWFKIAKPNPTDKDIYTQIGCHFEEMSEMERALFKHSARGWGESNQKKANFIRCVEIQKAYCR